MKDNKKIIKNLMFRKENINQKDYVTNEEYVLSDKDMDRQKIKIQRILSDKSLEDIDKSKEMCKKI